MEPLWTSVLVGIMSFLTGTLSASLAYWVNIGSRLTAIEATQTAMQRQINGRFETDTEKFTRLFAHVASLPAEAVRVEHLEQRVGAVEKRLTEGTG